MRSPQPMLEAKGVTVRFGGLVALDDAGLRLSEGEILALIGPNGAGKTTMMNVLAGAIAPTSGTVIFKGEQVEGLPAHTVNAKGIARTFQSVELLHRLTVRENVMAGGVARTGLGIGISMLGVGPPNRIRRRLHDEALSYLETVGLAHRADDPASILPAGQQRLLGIARALATGGELILLDEPGAGLNDIEKVELIEVIRRLRDQARTILFVEHDMSVVGQLAERIVVLDQGRVIAEGTPEQVRRSPEVIEAYLGQPASLSDGRLPDPPAVVDRPRLLGVENLSVRYGELRALNDISLDVGAGEIVTVIGANGAGKSTLLKAISGFVPPAEGEMTFDGQRLNDLRAEQTVAAGIGMAPEGRELFPTLSVIDNLMLGNYPRIREAGFLSLFFRSAALQRQLDDRLAQVFELFPILAERRGQLAGTLSGGQGQMLAIGRALMSGPKLLMLDEPSLGLAPLVVSQIMATLRRLRDDGLTILLIEQNARAALEIADRAYVLAAGNVVASGDAAKLANDKSISDAYLGWEGAMETALSAASPTDAPSRAAGEV